jgi:hypothetical protein
MKRDVLVHGHIPFYELSTVWVRADGVVTTTTTLTKSVDDMIRISKGDHEVIVRSDRFAT